MSRSEAEVIRMAHAVTPVPEITMVEPSRPWPSAGTRALSGYREVLCFSARGGFRCPTCTLVPGAGRCR